MTGTSHDQAAGAAIGGILGFAKSLTMITSITVTTVFETGLLAAVGATVGFLVTGLLKYVKKKFFS
jgi:hypothetical protein